MSEQYDVYFRGDIAPGHQMVEVRQRLQALFKLDDARAAKLFSGRPLAIRRDLDKAGAEQYRETLLKAGALVELRSSASGEVLAASSPAASSVETPSRDSSLNDSELSGSELNDSELSAEAAGSKSEPESAEAFSLAPAGADVLLPEERVVVEAVEVDTSALDLAPVGGDLLKDDEKRVLEDLDIDLSHLSVEPID
ncbi:MAG: hypothetical protein KBT63_05245 [Porticoccaceae bacterium]|nr:hypothetical protein [Porticoccaceae bacterium]